MTALTEVALAIVAAFAIIGVAILLGCDPRDDWERFADEEDRAAEEQAREIRRRR